jgi:MFS family permease
VKLILYSISGAACNIVIGLVASKIAGKYLVFAGACGTALANVLFAIMNEKTTYWAYQFVGMALCGVGSEISATVASIYIANVVNIEEVAVAGATLQFGIMLANVCAPSFSTLIYSQLVIAKNGALLTQQESKKNQTLLKSLRATFWFWAAMSFTGKYLARWSGRTYLMPIHISAAFLTVALLRSLNKVGKKAPESKHVADGEGTRKEGRSPGEGEPHAENGSLDDRKASCLQQHAQNGDIAVRFDSPSDREKRPDDHPMPKA